MYDKSIGDPLKDIRSIGDPLKDIRSSFQSLQKQLENVCRIPEVTTNISLVGEARAAKNLLGEARAAKNLIGEARAINKTQLEVESDKIDGIFKPLPGMSNKFDSIFKPLPGMSNKIIDDIFNPSEIIRNSAFAELTNISKQVYAHLRNPIPKVSAKSFIFISPNLNFPNSIIPRPVNNSIFPLVPEERRTPSPETDSTTITDEVPNEKRIFIGHGHCNCWVELRDFIEKDLGLSHDEFNRVSTPGLHTIERLQQMIDTDQVEIAFLIMTAENQYADTTWHARENVVHEIGLFQGVLGFKKAIILLEEGCEEFSNIKGLGQIRFPKGNIKAAFQEIREVLERERIIS